MNVDRKALSRRELVSLAAGVSMAAVLAGRVPPAHADHIGLGTSRPVPEPAAGPGPDDADANGQHVAKLDPVPLSPEMDSSGFVLLADAVPDAIQEARYYTTFNFVGDRIDGYEDPVVMVTREAGEALAYASSLLVAYGYRLKVYDAYRPQMAVDHFVRWSQDLSDQRMKAFFYPGLDKSVLFDQGYIARYSGHTRGSAIDLTLFDMAAGRDADMGGSFDLFDERSHPDFTDLAADQYDRRMLLRQAMIESGFAPVPTEWWHFILVDEPYPDTYFTFPVRA